MKTVLLMFDSLRKDNLSFYNPNAPKTSSFDRIAEVSTVYQNFYIGSMPCIPARRDLQTGRYNFMHRSWGPMEPFDNSFPEILRKHKVYTHLVTDHKHYWREGGATYHVKFNSYEFVRGQEGDAWKGIVNGPKVVTDFFEPELLTKYKHKSRQQDLVNQKYITSEDDFPLVRTIKKGIEFIEANNEADDWFLQIECFDPHEPFHVSDEFLNQLKESGPFHGWPPYGVDNLEQSMSQSIKNYYEALILMIDKYVGKLNETFDRFNMWEDTALIVNTDHGFLLGEHEWWGKNMMPIYNEIANIPLLIHMPGQREKNYSMALVQNINLASTILEFYDVKKPIEMIAESIQNIEQSTDQKTVAFGYFGSCLNATDGRYVYMRTPDYDKRHLFNEYTLMPTHINSMFSVDELKEAQLVKGFDFTKGVPVLKIPAKGLSGFSRFGDKLYDLSTDPKQTRPIDDVKVEVTILAALYRIAKENDAPSEFYEIYGLTEQPTEASVMEDRSRKKKLYESSLNGIEFEHDSLREGYLALIDYFSDQADWTALFNKQARITETLFWEIVNTYALKTKLNEIEYTLKLQMRID